MIVADDLEEPVSPEGPGPEAGWSRTEKGKDYIPRKNGRGIIWRQGDETVEQALARDGQPKPPRPVRKSKTPKKPAPPKGVDLKELEAAISEALKSPAMLCGLIGDQWAANHFTQAGPYLARNLIVSSEHNPWLRRKLEIMATGGDAAMAIFSLMGVAGGILLYVGPPAIYFLNLPADKARQILDIPYRNPADAPAPPPSPVAPPATATAGA